MKYWFNYGGEKEERNQGKGKLLILEIHKNNINNKL